VVGPVVGASGIFIGIFRVAVRWRVAIWGGVVDCILATLLGVKDKVVGDIKEGMGRWDEDDLLFVAARKFRLSLEYFRVVWIAVKFGNSNKMRSFQQVMWII